MQDDDIKQWDDGLKPNQRKFCLAYCGAYDETLEEKAKCLLNASNAYRYVHNGVSDTTANSNGSRNLRELAEPIHNLQKMLRENKDEKNAERVLNALENLSLFNPADIINARGELIVDDIRELGPLAVCIQDIVPTKDGKGKVILAPRTKYMEMLAKYLDIVRPEQQTVIQLPVVETASKPTGEDAVEQWNAKADRSEIPNS